MSFAIQKLIWKKQKLLPEEKKKHGLGVRRESSKQGEKYFSDGFGLRSSVIPKQCFSQKGVYLNTSVVARVAATRASGSNSVVKKGI